MKIIRIPTLGLIAYQKEGTTTKWLLPVCASIEKRKLDSLSPNHIGNWEDVDFDGCQTICYRFTTKEIKKWRGLRFCSIWSQFEDRLGHGPSRHYFGELYVKYNNIKACARNKWEQHHGGIRIDRFDRGMSVRESAHLSLT